ncbi:MAG: conserved membrane protein of unknown function [Candidatus Thorarchaeota archaeon]|nr:MAG: conserved membrane protein of unknown function [Candidatus Thorarchaeota archaeon]
MNLSRYPRYVIRFVNEYGIFIAILVFGVFVYQSVFSAALEDYLDTSLWIFRSVWLGEGEFSLFGFTLSYQFEGYSDYSFYYVHWGHNMLDGVMPYTPDFGYREIGWYVNENGLYIFPPLTALFYALGIMLPVDNWGIGFLLVIFSYLTVFPVYGIGRELSDNRHVGEAAAFTYLLSPSVLYHSVFLWMNPAPFVFFFFMGFYMLTRGNKLAGTLLIVVAALFKQTAWFLGFPLIAFLLIRGKSDKSKKEQQMPIGETEEAQGTSGIIDEINTTLDIPGFIKYTLIVLIFVGSIMLPFIISQPYMLDYMRLAMGGFPLEPPFTEPPGYGTPITLPYLPVMAGLPEVAELMNEIIRYGFLLYFGVILIAGLMFLEPRDNSQINVYLRRLLFLSLIMMLWVYLAGPRGVFKYYFVLMAPFFSILSSTEMVTSKEEHVSFSFSMFWLPIALSLFILIPPREIYLFAVIIITLGYALASKVGLFWSILIAPFGWVSKLLHLRFSSVFSRMDEIKKKIENTIYPERYEMTA